MADEEVTEKTPKAKARSKEQTAQTGKQESEASHRKESRSRVVTKPGKGIDVGNGIRRVDH